MTVHKLSWIAVILWLAFIFYLSHQPATESNNLSTGVTEVIVKTVQNIVPKVDFDIRSFNHLVRKYAHFIVYLVSGVLVINILRIIGMRGYRSILLALGLCVLYAISDEVHQLFIPGRGAELRDVLIDSAGASVGIGLYLFIGKMMRMLKNIFVPK